MVSYETSCNDTPDYDDIVETTENETSASWLVRNKFVHDSLHKCYKQQLDTVLTATQNDGSPLTVMVLNEAAHRQIKLYGKSTHQRMLNMLGLSDSPPMEHLRTQYEDAYEKFVTDLDSVKATIGRRTADESLEHARAVNGRLMALGSVYGNYVHMLVDIAVENLLAEMTVYAEKREAEKIEWAPNEYDSDEADSVMMDDARIEMDDVHRFGTHVDTGLCNEPTYTLLDSDNDLPDGWDKQIHKTMTRHEYIVIPDSDEEECADESEDESTETMEPAIKFIWC